MINERVRHVRTYLGLSQAELANMIGVSQPAISQIENTGQIAPETLAAIAKATGFAPWFFEQGPLPDLTEGSLRFRKLGSSTKHDDEIIRASVRQAIEVFGRYADKVELPPVRIKPRLSGDPVTNDEIEELATEARGWLGVGRNDPIPNVSKAVERAGVLLIGSPREIEKHDAASYWPEFPTGRPIICYSRGYPGDRQRLSLSHEVGHLILHQATRIDGASAEREAFRFGAALLFPREVALREIETPVTLRQLAFVKARYGISVGALVVRCVHLRIIDSDRYTSLEKQISARGWRKNEPVHVPNEDPTMGRKLFNVTVGPQASTRRLSFEFGLPPMAARDLVA